MADAAGAAPQGTVVEVKDFGKGPEAIVARWSTEIDMFNKETRDWMKRCTQIMRRYRDERSGGFRDRRGYALLWSNVETVKPVLYARTPKADVQRRFKDADPIARLACDIAERALDYFIDLDGKFDHVMKMCVEDYVLPGQAVVWQRYVPHISKQPMPGGVEEDAAVKAEGQGPTEYEQVDYEEVADDYVTWQDFGRNAGARNWSEVYAVWRKAYMTRDELRERFDKTLGREKVDNIPLDYRPKGLDGKINDELQAVFQKATVYEIWCKSEKKVYWISKEFKDSPLDMVDDPLGLTDFFPTPRPLMATTTNDNMIPVPDYVYWQDQDSEISDLTNRISVVEAGIKVRGIYAANIDAIKDLLADAGDMDMVPIDAHAMAAMGITDLSKAIWMWPLETLAQCLQILIETRKQIIDDVYQITGISDILRGATDPNETATAQSLKSQWGGLRVRERQAETARYARDLLRIKAEIIFGHFSDQTILKMTNAESMQEVVDARKAFEGQMQEYQQAAQQAQAAAAQGQPVQPLPPPPQPPDLIGQALQLLKNNTLRQFRVDIETDSTVAPDEQAEKEARNEAINTIGAYLTAAGPLVQQVPQLMPFVKESVLWLARAYKSAAPLETALESSLDAAMKALMEPKQAPEDPKIAVEMKRLEVEAQDKAARVELDRNGQIIDAVLRERELDIKEGDLMNSAAREDERLGMEREAKGAELSLKGAEVQGNQMATREKLALEQRGAKTAEMQARAKMGLAPPEAEEGDDDPVAQAFVQQAQKTEQIIEGLGALTKAVAGMQATMEQAIAVASAERELVRDPVTKRATGSRIRLNA